MSPDGMDSLLALLDADDVEGAGRLLAVMVEAGLVDHEEATTWRERLVAWRLAHRTPPVDA